MSLMSDCQQWAKKHPGVIVFPDSLDVRAVQAALSVVEQGLGTPVLLANPFELREFCWRHKLPFQQLYVIDPKHSEWMPEFVDSLSKRMKDKSEQELTTFLSDPLWFGSAMLAHNKANYCIAGNISSTASVLRAGLRVLGLKQGTRTLSSIFMMISPNEERVLGFADCSVIPLPTVEQLADIAISSAESYEKLTGEQARVAMLSFSSHGSANHVNAQNVQQATALVRERKPDLIIDGELQFDAAIVPEVAKQKVKDSPLQGNANVLVFPSLEAGNIGYKIAQRLGGYQAIGPLLQGLNGALHDLSRGCSWQDMVQVAALAAKQSS